MFRKILVFGGILVALVICLMIIFRSYTKSFSPKEDVVIESDEVNIAVNYSRPYKKDRKIFGELVPYGEVWRTGANEPTTFTTETDLIIKDKVLEEGEYSLWTIPGPEMWQVIWNKDIPDWGVDIFNDLKASRNPDADALVIEAPVVPSSKEFEQFTIDLDAINDDIHMVLMWDNTMIVIPMTTVNSPK